MISLYFRRKSLSVFRSGRYDRRGGGLIIAVYSPFSFLQLKNITSTSVNEVMGVCIQQDFFTIQIINIYSRSVSITADLTKFCYNLQGSTLVLRDFNFHHPVCGDSTVFRNSESFVESALLTPRTQPMYTQVEIVPSFCSSDLFARVS